MAGNQRKSSGGARVCVTGATGFVGSCLVRKLLDAGYTVHATMRGTGDEEKVGRLRRLRRLVVPGGVAPERLVLFEADLYDPATFAPAIAGCQSVFLIATPFADGAAEAAVGAVRAILRQCAESGTVRRVIHTASMSTASPLTAAGYKEFIDESCWTPFDVEYPLRSADFDKYMLSKLLSEKELLSYNDGEDPAFEVVTLPLGLVSGDTLLGRITEALEVAVSLLGRITEALEVAESRFGFMRLLQTVAGSVPLVHVDDVCAALVFCMERPSPVSGRFLCAAAYPNIHDVVDHYASKYPHLDLLRETEEVARVQPERNKLGELGFRYKYGMEEILDGNVEWAARLGLLDASKLSAQHNDMNEPNY
ncbi:putative anthocyanidin reductase [Triticum dicoccoides]|uniref:putative anthocyanidin reductase n=1 Tax=Triticum dicoccoides TaxID=85692 RepID=UPI001890ED9E|nr:putative anthocyanidin reductase [Triticum dicoccoides]